jgi:hypothetical protein
LFVRAPLRRGELADRGAHLRIEFPLISIELSLISIELSLISIELSLISIELSLIFVELPLVFAELLLGFSIPGNDLNQLGLRLGVHMHDPIRLRDGAVRLRDLLFQLHETRLEVGLALEQEFYGAFHFLTCHGECLLILCEVT